MNLSRPLLLLAVVLRLAADAPAPAPAAPAAAAAAATAGTNAAAAAKEARHAKESDAFFNGPIQLFEVELPKASLESLRSEPRKPVPATVKVGTNRYEQVMVHVKGAAGSTRSIDDLPALTLNFDKQVPGQRIAGLDKIHLNNSVQDPSRMSEIVCSDLYLASGIPAARATQALVRLNGRDLGLYVLKEGFNKAFVARHFANRTGNLYDGGFLRDIDQDLQREVGEGPDDHADLKKLLAAALVEDPAKRKAALLAVLDVDRFATYTAIQVLTEDWDGYPCNRNNYRLYHDPGTGRFVFIPHGMDQMFGQGGMPLERGYAGVVAERCFQIGEFRELYWRKVAELLDSTFTVARMSGTIDAALVRQRASAAAKGRGDLRDIDGAVADLRNRIAFRVQNARQQLATRPRPVPFDAQGVARLAKWTPNLATDNLKASNVSDKAGHPLLQLAVQTPGAGSWRCRARLPAGKFRLEARASTEGVVPLDDERGKGLGLRVSGAARSNQMTGTTAWQTIGYDFVLPDETDVEFVAELRAKSGTGWFDPGSFLVRKLP